MSFFFFKTSSWSLVVGTEKRARARTHRVVYTPVLCVQLVFWGSMLRSLSPSLFKVSRCMSRGISIDASTLRGRDFDTMFSFSGAEQRSLLAMAGALKKRLRAPDAKPFQPLTGRTLSMIFQKRSTRTRVSAEGGFAQLGGHAIFLGAFLLQRVVWEGAPQ